MFQSFIAIRQFLKICHWFSCEIEQNEQQANWISLSLWRLAKHGRHWRNDNQRKHLILGIVLIVFEIHKADSSLKIVYCYYKFRIRPIKKILFQ